MDIEIDKRRFEAILRSAGISAALGFLNARTPHRFTGIYRYDGDMLRNEYLFDQFDTKVVKGEDVPLAQAYCSIVAHTGAALEVLDTATLSPSQIISGSPVISYCGVLIRDYQGEAYGALCHFDMKPCQVRVSDLPLLEAVAPLFFIALSGDTVLATCTM